MSGVLRTRVIISLLVVLLLGGLGISCQSSAPVSPTSSGGQPRNQTLVLPPGVTVVLNDFTFIPAEVTVRAGDTVIWLNQDPIVHTVTANDRSFTSGRLDKGDTFSYVFKEKGTFEYHCVPHPNMKGKIKVE